MATTSGTLIRHQSSGPTLLQHRLRLRVVSGPDAGLEAMVEGARLLIGSASDAHLCLTDPLVSRRHCAILVDGERYRLQDLESTNGTFVGEVRVTQAELHPGMTLRVGDNEVVFEPRQKFVRLSHSEQDSFGQLLGCSEAMRHVFGVLERIAPTELSCVLLGDTGTGKELAARALHDKSTRSAGPFVVLDCAAVSQTLFESELFGHERGAFTGADRSRPGVFELAHGGTLFIDEVGELPAALQPKLLRVLERRETRRLGASTAVEVDVRVLCATHRPLDDMTESGDFRSDLYFRLAEVVVALPPLAQRRADVRFIAEQMLSSFGLNKRFSAAALSALEARPWPGNVRELRNVVRRTAQLSRGDSIEPSDLGLPTMTPREDSATSPAPEQAVDSTLPLKEAREAWNRDLEARYVRALLERHDWDFDRAAASAEIHVKSLQRLARERGIRSPK